jgi:hypothetical protein
MREGVGREPEPTEVFWGLEDWGGALRPPVSEMRAIIWITPRGVTMR